MRIERLLSPTTRSVAALRGRGVVAPRGWLALLDACPGTDGGCVTRGKSWRDKHAGSCSSGLDVAAALRRHM